MNMTVMATEKINNSQCIGSPNRHHLKPSITPTMGFKENRSLYFSSTSVLLKPTGEMYRPNCIIKGMIYLKSRYFTFTAVRYRPTPNAHTKANSINKGRKIICQEGMNWYHTHIAIIMMKDIPRSTRLVITELAGMIILGK